MEKLYLLFNDYEVGYIDHICDCDKCKERGSLEVCVKNLEDVCLYYLTIGNISEYINNGKIITIGDSLSDILNYIKTNVIDNLNKKIHLLSSINKQLNDMITKGA